MATINYVLNKSNKNRKNECQIYYRIFHRNRRKLVYTKKLINPDFWDDKEGKVLFKKPNDKLERNRLKMLSVTLDEKINELKINLLNLERNKPNYTIDDILGLFEKRIQSSTVFTFIETLINRLIKANKIGNAKAYENTFGVFRSYRKKKDLTFDELDYRVLKRFEEHLEGKGRSVNAISFHMRTLRSVYNKAIKEGVARQEFYPFKDYKIKREKTTKRALLKEHVTAIKGLDLSGKPDLQKARDYFLFSFYTRGMSFVDMAHLKVKDIFGDRLYYARNKTNQKFNVLLTEPMLQIVRKYNDLTDKESYIFPVIIKPDGDVFTQYRNAMRLTNKKLKKIGEMLELPIPLTTYVARHSWATIAKRQGIATAIISEGLGHESEKTTQVYLDSFENKVLDDANDQIINI